MTDSPHIYRRFLAYGTSPAITWYSSDGRVELSGKVAATHVAKISSYLIDDVWLTPGAELLLDTPAAFKQVLWGLGALTAGMKVTIDHESSPARPHSPSVVVTNQPQKWVTASSHHHVFPSGKHLLSSNEHDFSSHRQGTSSYEQGASSRGKDTPQDRSTSGENPVHTAAQLQAVHPSALFQPDDILALDLAPLAFSWNGAPLPEGTRDATAEVMGAPDVLLNEYDHHTSNIDTWHMQGEKSNRSYITHPGTEKKTDRDALLLVAPGVCEALAAAVWARCRLVVVDNPSQVGAVKRAEKLS